MLNTLTADAIADKSVLLRYDLNVSFHDNAIVDDSRLQEAAGSIKTLLQRKPRALVIMAHLGRPKGKRQNQLNLQKVQNDLSTLIGQAIYFVDDPLVDVTPQRSALPQGSVVLLQNTRFWPGEEENAPAFAKKLAAWGDVYVNEAFSASHRAHASTCGVANYLNAFAGPLLAAEISTLERCLEHPKRPNIAVVGGSKISTKIGIIEHLIPKLDHLIIGGAMANTFLFAQGNAVGRSLYEAEAVDLVSRIIQLAEKQSCQINLPSDVVVASELTAGDQARNYAVDAIPADQMILDIGTQSTDRFCSLIDDCQTVLWNGPLGAFEFPPFAQATIVVAQHVAKRTQAGKCLSVAGGGDTLAALKKANATEGFSHVSSAGGAFLEWLQGDTLPGIEILQRS